MDNEFDDDSNFDDTYSDFFEPNESDLPSDENKQKTLGSKGKNKEDVKIRELEETNKNQREMIRQLGEELKDLKEWKNKITGMSQEDLSKKEELEMRQRFEEDNIGVVNELIEQKVKEVENKLNEQVAISNVKEAMSDIDKEYFVDWDRDYPKIVSQLNNFSQEAKQRDPKGVLLAACRLAGVIKKRDTSIPTYIEGANRYGIPKQVKSAEDEIRNRIKGYSAKPHDNIFRI